MYAYIVTLQRLGGDLSMWVRFFAGYLAFFCYQFDQFDVNHFDYCAIH